MLDGNHPMAPYISQAGALIGRVMRSGQTMSVSPSKVRQTIFQECLPLLVELRELALAKFSTSIEYLLASIEEFELGLRKLVYLGDGHIIEDRRDGEGNCPYCGTRITKFKPTPDFSGFEHHFIIYCQRCTELFMPAKEKLESFDGFGTMGI